MMTIDSASERSATLSELLRQRGDADRDKQGFIYLTPNGESRSLTYGELSQRAGAVGAWLKERGFETERAILVYQPGPEFLIAFLGCVYAGAIAVPVAPPRNHGQRERLQRIIRDAEAKIVLTTGDLVAKAAIGGLDVVATEAIADPGISVRELLSDVKPDAQNVAYLQYTSGSTSHPKGVKVTHRNVLCNSAQIAAATESSPDDVMVTWLPHFHDMGLVYGLLQPLFKGFLCVHLSAASFLQRPLFWLETISQYRGTVSAAPNFAYDLCARRVQPEQQGELNLRSWRAAITGSEPVQLETLERFAAVFAGCGFRKRAFKPAYGLAEATLMVSMVQADEDYLSLSLHAEELRKGRVCEVTGGKRISQPLIACGTPGMGTRVEIVKPETEMRCRDGEIGEIWVAGQSVGAGYWKQDEESEKVFRASLADTGEGPFLRTGDLGFIRQNQIVVCGRLKDLIIIRGQNFYPQDIEQATANCHPSLRRDSGAAFSVEIEGQEQLVIVFEVERTKRNSPLEEVITEIRRAIANLFELQPHAILLLKPASIPKTSSGKIQRRVCRQLFLNGEFDPLLLWTQPTQIEASPHNSKIERIQNPAGSSLSDPEVSRIREWLMARLAEKQGIEVGEIDPRESFAFYGLDSKEAAAFSGELQSVVGRALPATLLYEYPNIEALAAYLAAREHSAESEVNGEGAERCRQVNGREPIAIIGLACRFPGAANADAYWRLMCDGIDAVTEVPSERWNAESFYDPDPAAIGKTNTKWGGFIRDIEMFDAGFFGISSKEAVKMDPQQRLLLEVTWEAIENSGQVRERLAGSQTGVFIGISANEYLASRHSNPNILDAYVSSGNALSVAANRLSYFFDWTGPSMAVDTACSSSLVAVHLACQSLWAGECGMAVAGGANLLLSPTVAIDFARAGLMAPDGRSKAFDARANGYVRADGIGVVLLKPLSQAVADGDPIYCVIRGSALGQDGHSNGLMAPSRKAQESLLRRAFREAGVSPGQIQYVEAHGTGTFLGDPIEANALGAVLATDRRPNDPCYVGSVKTNIGHAEAAAGIAGLIKVALALRHRQIPPTLHFEKPNPQIPFEKLPIRIPTRLVPWEGRGPRLAGVSSFGFGGTNAHVVLEEFCHEPLAGRQSRPAPQSVWLLPLSARSTNSLKSLATAYKELLESPERDSADLLNEICFTASVRRTHHRQRAALVAHSRREFIEELDALVRGDELAGIYISRAVQANRRGSGKLAWVFPGHGAQWRGMGRELLHHNQLFRQSIEDCQKQLATYTGWNLFDLLNGDDETLWAREDVVQPLLLTIEIGLARVWASLGIRPDAVIGHSMGEVAAAYWAGALDLAEAFRIVCLRSRLVRRISGQGGMISAALSSEEADRLASPFEGRLIASVSNSPHTTVFSGDLESLGNLTALLENRGIFFRPVGIDYAAHSPQLDNLKADFFDGLNGFRAEPAALPIYSPQTGERVLPGGLDADYWWGNLRQPILFAKAVKNLVEEGFETFLEVSPHPVLSIPLQECAEEYQREITILPTLRRQTSEREALLSSLATLYANGIEIDWKGVYQEQGQEQRRHIFLPPYPFERNRYWFEDTNGLHHTSIPQLIKSIDRSPVSARDAAMITTNARVSNNRRAATRSDSITPPANEAQDHLLADLRQTLGRLIEMPPEEIDLDVPFLEMGADSIVLVNAIRTIEKRFGVSLTIRQLFQTHTNLRAVADYIEEERRKKGEPQTGERIAQPPIEPVQSRSHEESESPRSENAVNLSSPAMSARERLMEQQLALVSRVITEQLQILRSPLGGGDPEERQQNGNGHSAPAGLRSRREAEVDAASSPQAAHGTAGAAETGEETFVPYRPIRPGSAGGLEPRQQQHLDSLIARYTARTPRSKEMAQRNRAVLADNRASAGFRFSIKEMLYPIHGVRSAGAKIWDVDGNEYIDLTMGFGVNLFGHGAPFITRAIEEQLGKGIQLGPQSDLAGEVAGMLCELTGNERAVFCNSGTEAVMMAMRLARTAHDRPLIALFGGSYHGTFDGVLAQPAVPNHLGSNTPLAPGIRPGAVEDVIVLDYGKPESLTQLHKYAGKLAAVLVEPVQSRRPDLQPREFLRELRRFTEAHNIALIFDEVITGFRIALGGAQEWFGVKADLVTYGKILGGGMPIGVVAGRAAYLDGIDGGHWRYNDHSYPQATTTFFAGTFCKHPLTMAAARAVLKRLKDEGPGLQQTLNSKTSSLAAELNTFFVAEEVPIRIDHFGSLFRFAFHGNLDLLFYHLMEKGIYIWEGRNCFLSTAHTETDLEVIVNAVKESVRALRQGGFFPARSGAAIEKPDKEREASGDETRSLPLTEVQRHLWMVDQMDQEASLACSISVAVELKGRILIGLLRRALQRVCDRNEALRIKIDGTVRRQVILPELEIPLRLENLEELPASEQEQRVKRLLEEEGRTRFDLSSPPPLRIRIIRLAEDRHLLVLSAHHIAVDGWSMDLLLDELMTTYGALVEGVEDRLRPPVPFSDYVLYSERRIGTAKWREDEAYWLAQFAEPASLLDLPTDYPRPPVKRYQGARQSLEIGTKGCHRLKAFSLRQNCTLFMTLFAGYVVLLNRLTGQTDFVIGIPTADRKEADFERIIGCCVNMLPIRCSLHRGMTVAECLDHVRSRLLVAFEHDEYPFSGLFYQLAQTHDASRAPLFDVTFNLDRTPDRKQTAGLETTLVSFPVASANFDLTLNVIERHGGLLAELNYNTEIFSRETAQRWLAAWKVLMEEMAENPQQRIATLKMLSETERRQIVMEWNATDALHQEDGFAHEWFEKQVDRNPQAIAIASGAASLSYQQLNHRANKLAHYLKNFGIGPEVRVGVFLERDEKLVVTFLAVLKAGGVYVPLDPAYPDGRLAYMIEDSRARMVISVLSLSHRLPGHEGRLVLLDAEDKLIDAQSDANLAITVRPSNLAYIIYTSGSTGRPKGAMVEHRGMSNHLLAKVEELSLGPQDTVAQNAPSSFDISVWQMLTPLISGGRARIIEDSAAEDAERLAGQVPEGSITVLETVPAMLAVLLEEDRQRSLKGLRWLICNAEALPIRLCVEWHAAYPAVPLINAYGPTECSDDITHYVVPVVPPQSLPYAPLGKPLRNLRVYVLDGEWEPVPVGVHGEVLIGGIGVGRGYFNRPVLTAERYVPDPFSRESGARLYRTGDCGRWLANGELEFLGRFDHQVKLRGQRVELGEVESALAACAGVRQAVALVREDLPGDARLVAYIVGEERLAAELDSIRQALQGRLPEYMVPSALVILERLPLTPNGKLDRKALPAPVPQTVSGDFVAPRTAIEEILCNIWAEVLRVERIGITDDFFELGGHSLLATQVISRVRSAFEMDLPLRLLFEAPTPEVFAGQIVRARGENSYGELPLQPVSRQGYSLPLSFAQQRLWSIDQFEPASALYNLPFRLRLTGPLFIGILWRSLNEIVRRHEVLRTCFPAEDGQPTQQINPHIPIPLSIIDLSGLEAKGAERAAQRLARQEAARPFDLSSGPLLRLSLLRLAASEHVLLITLHHIVADGWSMSVLAKELTALYEAYLVEGPSPLTELPVQYADFAVWQRQWLQGEVLERQLAYWRKQLDGLELLELPADNARPAVPSYRGGMVSFRLSADLSSALQALSRQEGVTLFMTLLAGWQALLGRYAGQTAVTVGTDVANRNRLETEGLIGFFINQLVLRADLQRTPDFREMLRRTRDVTLAAYSNQDLPFERLVEELAPVRLLGRAPLFQVKFVLYNTPQPELRMSRVMVQLDPIPAESAKFDLSLLIEQNSGLGMSGELEYAADLFEASTVERVADHFSRLLQGAVADPSKRISDLSLLSAAERSQLIAEWRGTTTVYPVSALLHERFASVARRQPNAVALTSEGREWTYAELNEESNRIAHLLQSLEVGPEVLVALCFDRSPQMVLAILAVLKSGGAYVPLDPAYPSERLTYLLNDTRARVLLTQQSLRHQLPASAGAEVICLDAEPSLMTFPVTDPDSKVKPDNLAYVIYTSGSTGDPKGVMVTHRNLTRLMASTEAFYEFGPEDVWTLFHSYAFDFSVWEIWGALAYGGRLVIVPHLVSRTPELFYDLLVAEKVTVLNQTPSAFRQLIMADEQKGQADQLAGALKGKLMLRWVIFGGEALDLASLDPWVKRHGLERPRLVNMYGITETTVHVTCCPLSATEIATAQGSLIGRSLPDLQLYVLDEGCEPTLPGAPGGLSVGGAGLARGYLTRPALTAERFVPDPFSDEPGARLYQSGDLARYWPDGTLEYLGRSDQQVKIRGFRIELGEIESILSRHPDVGESVVVAHTNGNDRSLVAYVASRSDRTITSPELRAYLRRHLPDYMVPSALVVLDRLPLTPNGKLDRKALPSPEAGHQPAQKLIEPETETERTLVNIWRQVLRRERVGIEDNFFELGGDSILGIQVVARANRAGLRLSARHLFKHQTIRELAIQELAIRELARDAGDPVVGPEAPQEIVTGPVERTPIQRWFFTADLERPEHFNQALLLEPHRPLEAQALRRAVAALLTHHDGLRTRYAGGQSWIEEREAQEVTCEIDLRELPAGTQQQALKRAADQLQAGLNLERGPLVRVGWYRLQEGERLQIVIHHLAVDGVSWRILLEDLSTTYKQAQGNRAIRLPAKTHSYPQWAAGLVKYAASAEVQGQVGFWEGIVRRVAGHKPLPRDGRRGANTVESSAVVEVMWSEWETTALLEQVGRYGAGMQEALLAGLVDAVTEWSGSRRLLVELEGHGREEIGETLDVSRTVGWFTTLYPVLLECAAGRPPRERLEAVRKQLPAPAIGMSHGLLLYLTEEEGLRRRLRTIKPEMSFNYLGQYSLEQGTEAAFRLAPESPGAHQHRIQLRPYLIDIIASIIEGRLKLQWIYSRNFHHPETIERLAERMREVIGTIFNDEDFSQPKEQADLFLSMGLTEADLQAALENISVRVDDLE